CLSLGRDWLRHEDLATRTLTDQVMKESLRLIPPVPVLPRRTRLPVSLAGHRIPAGTPVVVSPLATHLMTSCWDRPLRFEPDRFGEGRAEHKRHPYQFVPFGGGAHMCIGLHFGEMEIKAIMHQLLQHYRWQVPDRYEMPVNYTSLPTPSDQLPVVWELL
ncbi:MAG: cytochrome P450, partial [Perlucidibaca sp.]